MGWNRVRTIAIVAALFALLRWTAPHPEARELWLYGLALPLGYGHLIGALQSTRRRATGSRLERAFVATAVLNLLVLYLWALRTPSFQLPVTTPLLLISAWHIFENDAAMSRAYANRHRVGPVSRSMLAQLAALGGVAGVAALTLTTASGARVGVQLLGSLPFPLQMRFSADELAAVVLLYHAVSWVGFLLDSARPLPQPAAARLRARVFWLHALPVATAAACHFASPGLYALLAAPPLYLFWSVLHALQTAARRGWARETGPGTAPAATA